MSHRLKPRDIAAPIDIRLLPATAVTAVVCWSMPALTVAWSVWIPVACMSLGALSVAAAMRWRTTSRVYRGVLLVALACWLATPAAWMTHQQMAAAQDSGWTAFIDDLGTARMSVQLKSDPTQRDGPFGPSWFATAQVQSFGRDQTPTPHPAQILISGDSSWDALTTGDQSCFIGRVTEADNTVFVQALTDARPGSCTAAPPSGAPTGRHLLRSALREQTAHTIGYAPQLLPGLILGNRTQQHDSLDTAMKVSGLSHLSAVSGSHTSLIVGAATLLFRSLRLSRPVVTAACLATLVLFVLLVGPQPSVIRAATMGAIGAWAVFSGRGAHTLPILALTTMMLLTLSPHIIHDVGFQLSVVATAGIVLGAQPLDQWWYPYFAKYVPDGIARLASSSLAISTAAQVACQPVLLTFVDYVSLYSIAANLLATPLLPLITIPGTIAAGVTVVLPEVAQLIFHAVAFPATAIGTIATTASTLPGAKLPWPQGSSGTLLVILHWMATGIIWRSLLRRQRQPAPPVRVDSQTAPWQRLLRNIPRRWSLAHTIQSLIVAVAVSAHLAVFWPHTTVIDPAWDIIGCDVGQGDMFLIRTGPQAALVIDTGPEPALAQDCLQAANITRIDTLLITHLHADHVGGIQGVTTTVTPDRVLYSTSSHPPGATMLPNEAQQVTGPMGQLIDHAAQDDDHAVQVRWSILAANQQATNENNASLVILVELARHDGTITALFTGDLEADEASRLIANDQIPPNVDVLKIAHHGARNGGTKLLDHTDPDIVLLGVGRDNPYGHPHHSILNALDPQVQLRRTDQQGTFSVTFQPSAAHLAAER